MSLNLNKPIQCRNGWKAFVSSTKDGGLKGYYIDQSFLYAGKLVETTWGYNGGWSSFGETGFDLVNTPEPVADINTCFNKSWYEEYLQAEGKAEFHKHEAERYKKLAELAEHNQKVTNKTIDDLKADLSTAGYNREARDERIKELQSELDGVRRQNEQLLCSNAHVDSEEVSRMRKQLLHAGEGFKLLKNYLNSKAIGELIHDGEVKKLYP